MAKAIKNALIAAAVVLAVAVALQLPLSLALVSGGTLTATGMAAMTFGTTLLSGIIAGSISAASPTVTDNMGTKLTTMSPVAPRQIIYGTTRVGGTILHMETSGTDNFKLHIVAAIAGHEINSLTNLRMNGINLTTSTATVSGETVHTVTNSEFTNTENEQDFGSGRLIRYTFHDGAQTAADGLAVAALSSITTNHKFKGIAYVYIEMIFDPEVFGSGMPEISYLVKGKDLFDPRTNAVGTSDAQRSNPALIIRDYLTNTTYGLKATSAEINDTTNAGGFAAAANTCDQTILSEKRYTANGFTNYSTSGEELLQGILSSMAGKISYVNGEFNIFAGAAQTPSLTITDDELLAPVEIQTNPSGGDLFNQVKAVYVDAATDYTATDAPLYSDSTFLGADTPSGQASANFAKLLEVQLPYTTSATMAQRLGRISLNYQRQTIQMSCLVSTQFMRLQPNDWVYVTNSRMSWTQKIFEVISTNLEQVGDAEAPVVATRLSLKEVEDEVWDFVANDYTTAQSEGGATTTGSYAVTAPSNLALSQTLVKDALDRKITIQAAWDNNTSPMVTQTEVAYKLNGDSNFSAITVLKGVEVANIPNGAVGEVYNVKIRHIDLNGVTSAYTSAVNITLAATTTAPAVPSSVAVTTGKAFNIMVTYTNPNTADLKAVKIYRKTANSTPNTNDTDGLVHTQYGNPNSISTWIDGKVNGLTAGTTYYYFVRSVNHSDVHSAFVAIGGGNFTSVDTVDIATDAITNALIATDAVNADSIVANAVTATEINVGNLAAISADMGTLTAGTINGGTINGTNCSIENISASNITTGTIAAARIDANSITANLINVNHIAANSITVDNGALASGAVVTAKVSDNAITEIKTSYTASVTLPTSKAMTQTNTVTFSSVDDFDSIVLMWTAQMTTGTGNKETIEAQFQKGTSTGNQAQVSNLESEINTGVLGDTDVGGPIATMSFTDTNLGTGSRIYTVKARVSSAGPNQTVVMYYNHFTAIGVKK